MGDTTEKSQEVFKLVSAMAYYSMGKMALSFMDHPHLDHKARDLEVANLVNNMVDNDYTDFGTPPLQRCATTTLL